jgi:hypothetical protein
VASNGASSRGVASPRARRPQPVFPAGEQRRSWAMAGGGASRRPLHSEQAVDVASASTFRAFEILHLHLDLRVEFGPPGPGPGSRGLSGTAVLELRSLRPEGATELQLDSHPCLEVTAVTLRRERPGSEESPAESVPFHTRPFSHYGQALYVAFPQPCLASERFQLVLSYRVGEGPGVSARPCAQPWPQASLSASCSPFRLSPLPQSGKKEALECPPAPLVHASTCPARPS